MASSDIYDLAHLSEGVIAIMQTILTMLMEGMEHDVRQQADRRYQALARQLEYLKENQNIDLVYTFKHKWNIKKYRLLFALNSFYQIVIGPLASSAQNVPEVEIGGKVPILWGHSIRFDVGRNAAVKKTYVAFLKLASRYGFNEVMLNGNQAGDIVYYVAKRIRKNEEAENEE